MPQNIDLRINYGDYPYPGLRMIRLGQPYCAFMLPAKAERADVVGLVDLLSKTAPLA